MKLWYFFVIGAFVSWGMYGPAMHNGTVALGKSPMRALLCVGGAYFLLAVLVPLLVLYFQPEAGQFTAKGISWATFGGALGAAGAICAIFALRYQGTPQAPLIVMPLVFGGAPVVNAITSAIQHPPQKWPHPALWVGLAMVALGAYLILRFKPT